HMKDLALMYGGDNHTLKIIGYSDADWGSDLSRKSIYGNTFLLGGATISWMSKKQSVIMLSTCEVEYISACQAAKQSYGIRDHSFRLGNLKTPQPHCIMTTKQLLHSDMTYNSMADPNISMAQES